MYYKAIVIVLIGCIALLSQAMESIIPSIEIKSSNTIISSVAFLGNNAVVVAGDKGCQIFSKNKLNCYEQKQSLSTESIVDMSLSFDGKKLACATRNKIILYEVSSDRLEECYSKQVNDCNSISCNNSSLFALLGKQCLISYDYNAKKYREYDLCKHYLKRDYSLADNISCHSIKNEIIIPIYAYGVCLINFDDEGDIIRKDKFDTGHGCRSCRYNFDNSMMVLCGSKAEGYQCIDLKQQDNWFIVGGDKKQDIQDNTGYASIEFHKNNDVAVLLKCGKNANGVVEFRQYKESKLLVEINLNMIIDDWAKQKKILAFSEDGNKLVVAGKNRCIVLDVPIVDLQVSFSFIKGTKEYITTVIRSLNYICYDVLLISEDVKKIIITNALELRRISNNVLVQNKINDISIKKVSAEVDYRAPSTVNKPIEKAKVLNQAPYKNLWDDAIKSEKWTTIAIVARKICVMRWWHSLSRFKQSIVSLSIMVPLVYFMKILCHKLIRRYVFSPVL